MRVTAVLFSAGLGAILSAPFTVAQEVPYKPDVAAAWYPGWHSKPEEFPLSKVPWSKYTHLNYAFAQTTPDVGALSLEKSSPETLSSFVSEAHKNNVKALISVGGWTGSRFFSTAVATPENRTAFVKTVVDFVQQYKLDGVDFRWQNPNDAGIGCNTFSPADTGNFLLYLQELRAHPVAAQMIVTAAAATKLFSSPDGQPSQEGVAAFVGLLDYVVIMNHDLWGGWSTTVGPNGPLDDQCAPPEASAGSAASAAQSWFEAGVPFNKLVLAVPGYGRGFRVRRDQAYENGSATDLKLYAPFDNSDMPFGDAWATRKANTTNVCGVLEPAPAAWNFWALISEGYLNADGTPAPGIGYRYDECSHTPYVYNANAEIMISYDNAESFTAKGDFIKGLGLKGFAMWEAAGDYNNILLDSIRSAGGFDEPNSTEPALTVPQ